MWSRKTKKKNDREYVFPQNAPDGGKPQKGRRFGANWQREEQPPRRERKRLGRWNRFVLIVGYLSLAYWLARGVIWVLVALGGIAQ